jgi:hypothetical protein
LSARRVNVPPKRSIWSWAKAKLVGKTATSRNAVRIYTTTLLGMIAFGCGAAVVGPVATGVTITISFAALAGSVSGLAGILGIVVSAGMESGK